MKEDVEQKSWIINNTLRPLLHLVPRSSCADLPFLAVSFFFAPSHSFSIQCESVCIVTLQVCSSSYWSRTPGNVLLINSPVLQAAIICSLLKTKKSRCQSVASTSCSVLHYEACSADPGYLSIIWIDLP